jgi:hypothetical protein
VKKERREVEEAEGKKKSQKLELLRVCSPTKLARFFSLPCPTAKLHREREERTPSSEQAFTFTSPSKKTKTKF